MNLIWLFLPGILYLGIISCYTDIRFGKIKNRDIFLGVGYAVLAYFGIFIFQFMNGQFSYFEVFEVFTNAAFAITVAFGLWYLKLWSAGDGKLFFAFAMLVPFVVYQKTYYQWVPSLNILFNAFIVGFALAVILILKDARLLDYRRMIHSFLHDFFKPARFFDMVFSLFAVFWLISILLQFLGMANFFLVRYLLTILLMSFLPRIFAGISQDKKGARKYRIYIMGMITLARFIIDDSIYSLGFLLDFLLLVLVWKLFRGIFRHGVQSLGKDLFSKEVLVKDLKPNMILSDNIVKSKKIGKKEADELKKEGIEIVRKGGADYLLGNVEGKCLINAESEGLEERHIKLIRKIGFKKVKISTTIPFAPLIFSAVLLTLLIKGNILILIHFLP